MDRNTILGQKNWTVEQFNSGRHLRINGVVDVWPSTRKWMVTESGEKSKQFANLKELKGIVDFYTKGRRDKAEQLSLGIAATTAAVEEKKRPVPEMTIEEWNRRFA